jgi:hypothetical protein
MTTTGVTHEQLVAAFGEDGVVRVPADKLPDTISDALTREVLTARGLPTEAPEDFVLLAEDLTEGMRPLPRAAPFTGGDWDVPPGFAEFLFLGTIVGPYIGQVALDGKTGVVHNITELDASRPHILNSSLAAFAYFIYVLKRDQESYSLEYCDANSDNIDDETEMYGQAAGRIEAELRQADSAAFSDPDNIWSKILQDISDGQWD